MMNLKMSKTGSTLSEVLIALLVMSIGVVSLATLFPISILRSIQATQLTNATILRLNAEEELSTNPQFIGLSSDPDEDGNLGEHIGTAYILDPMGVYSPLLSTVKNVFGHNAGASLGLVRYPLDPDPAPANGSLTGTSAFDNCVLPDSWVELFKAEPTTVTANQLTLPATITTTELSDLSTVIESPVSIAKPFPNYFQVTLYGTGVRSSVTRPLIAGLAPRSIDSATRQLNWLDALPASIGTVTKVKVEALEPRYSWLVTIRRTGTNTYQRDLVVFFRRRYQTEDEISNSLTGATRGNTQFTFTKALSTVLLKKGGFVMLFDDNDNDATTPPKNASWYQIKNIENETTTTATLTVDRPLETDANWGVAPRGIVQVYRLY